MNAKYNVNNISVGSILSKIEMGEIGIPDIQRPFVWKNTYVRDLIDSLYHGYPTGFLVSWKSADIELKNGEKAFGKTIIIDGQQRITALMTAILGEKVLNNHYVLKQIKIAFNPLAKYDEKTFEVSNPSHLKSKKWIEDISILFKNDFNLLQFLKDYIKNNTDANEEEVYNSLNKIFSLTNAQLGIIELDNSLDIDEVTEVFIRINSKGQELSQSDFAMSKIASDEKYGGSILRKTIDYFSHVCKNPNFYDKLEEIDKEFFDSKYNNFKYIKNLNQNIFVPEYTDMLRVSFVHKFERGRIKDLVSLLSGRDFETRDYLEEIEEESFQKLEDGISNFINQYNFTQFILTIKSAGFINSRLIRSQSAISFAYILFLILKEEKKFKPEDVKRYVQKWYVFSVLTGRYSSSPETKMDQDIRNISKKGFLDYFEEIQSAELSETYWNVRLVQDLETNLTTNPRYLVYLAAQIYLGDDSLFKNIKVNDLLEISGDIHHIFPKKYLQENNMNNRNIYNQIANYVYLDKPLNIKIGKKAPNEYFKKAFEKSSNNECFSSVESLKENLKTNCIPEEIINWDVSNYNEFLLKRRKLMAKKIKEYYYKL